MKLVHFFCYLLLFDEIRKVHFSQFSCILFVIEQQKVQFLVRQWFFCSQMHCHFYMNELHKKLDCVTISCVICVQGNSLREKGKKKILKTIFKTQFHFRTSQIHLEMKYEQRNNKKKIDRVDLFNRICLKCNWKMYLLKCKVNTYTYISLRIYSLWILHEMKWFFIYHHHRRRCRYHHYHRGQSWTLRWKCIAYFAIHE